MSTKPVIGWCGLGKLGTPLAVSIASRGYKVLGYDINPDYMKRQVWPFKEQGPDGKDDFQDYYDKADLSFLPLKEVIEQSDIVFIAVQTPHGPEYEGITRLPFSRADFDYTWLKEACTSVAALRRPEQVIVVVSTVLPGTMRREIIPMIPDLVYNPGFPAMTTVMRDFLYPEFVLIGSDDTCKAAKLRDFYFYMLPLRDTVPITACPIRQVSIESAELTKVSYNTLVTMKTVVANNILEISHKIPHCNVDEVTDTLCLATRRILSPAYMRGQMADGGHCHPRDNIAMSWLSEKLRLSCNLYDNLMHAREWQTEWLAHLFINYSGDLPKVILGKAYKEGTGITGGSGAILLANLLKEKAIKFEHYDPYVDGALWEGEGSTPFGTMLSGPRAFFIATKHEIFKKCAFPEGSVVIDPFRYLDNLPKGVKYIPIGIGR